MVANLLNFRLKFFLYNISQFFCTILETRDLINWKHYQLYTPPVQRSAWRWSCNWAETCSWNYNL